MVTGALFPCDQQLVSLRLFRGCKVESPATFAGSGHLAGESALPGHGRLWHLTDRGEQHLWKPDQAVRGT